MNAVEQSAESDWDPRRSGARAVALDHRRRTVLMLLETFGVSLGLAALSTWAWQNEQGVLAGLLAVPRGLWIQRHYCVGHEAAHGKLFPGRPWRNAVWGQLALLTLLTPLRVFRKIHQFHHGHNRRDLNTSALEVIWIAKDTRLRRFGAWCQWLGATYACGWFWHGLISILLFLMLPVSVAVRISPAFRGWSSSDRVWSIAAFAFALLLHGAAWAALGSDGWLVLVGAPLAVFSWIYSAQLYIYHYDSTTGPNVTHHARSLGGPWVNWWLLNLNEHDTHHQRPAIVWYALPDAAARAGRGPQARMSFLSGIRSQLKGPRIVVRAGRV
jgi:fatty acid desaturase